MIEALIYTVLANNADVKSRVNTRIYPVVMPQDVTLPAVSYQRISANPINYLGGYTGLKNADIVINAWGKSYDELKTLASKIHTAMNAATTFKCVLTNELDGFDPEIQLYVISQDYSCWGQE
jgi:hypothetical protein